MKKKSIRRETTRSSFSGGSSPSFGDRAGGEDVFDG
jgi:hypothetical protein